MSVISKEHIDMNTTYNLRIKHIAIPNSNRPINMKSSTFIMRYFVSYTDCVYHALLEQKDCLEQITQRVYKYPFPILLKKTPTRQSKNLDIQIKGMRSDFSLLTGLKESTTRT